MSNLGIPPSNSIVEVKAINPGSFEVYAAFDYFAPIPPGREIFSASSLCFFIENKRKGKRVLFDLGISKYSESLAPRLKQVLKAEIKTPVVKDAADQLREHGIQLDSISAVIWSHGHYDHLGNIGTFPKSTELVFAVGTKQVVFPPFPENPDSLILEDAVKGRKITEIDFETSKFGIGGLKAHDYFGDGSLYLLDAPGHVTGHIVALARVTSTTFILLGADSCHHPAMLRPNANNNRFFPCPGMLLTKAVSHEYFYENGENPEERKQPLLHFQPPGFQDHEAAKATIRTLGEIFDAHPDVLVIIAHDTSLLDPSELISESLNAWKEKNWKQQRLWNFLDEKNAAYRFRPRS